MGLAVAKPDRCGEHGPNLRHHGLERGSRDGRRIDLDGELYRLSLEADQRSGDGGPCALDVELAPALRGNHSRDDPFELDGGLAGGNVDAVGEQAELVVEARFVESRLRLDLDAEESDLQALEPTERKRSVSGLECLGDDLLPVDMSVELRRANRERLAGHHEDNGHGRTARSELPELLLRIGRMHSAQLDTEDRDAGRDLVGRAREGPSCADQKREKEHDAKENEAPDRASRSPPSPGRPTITPRTYTHLRAHEGQRVYQPGALEEEVSLRSEADRAPQAAYRDSSPACERAAGCRPAAARP